MVAKGLPATRKQDTMAIPTIDHHERPIPDKPITITAAAALAHITIGSLQELVDASYVELTGPHIFSLGQEPFVTAAGALPVLRSKVAARDGSWRPYSGDALWLSDEEWLQAHCDVYDGPVLTSEYLAVGLGGIVTGIARIEGITQGSDGPSRLKLSLVGRLVGTLKGGELSFGERRTKEELSFVRKTIGFRYKADRKAAFTWI